jgi:hypothetical protein
MSDARMRLTHQQIISIWEQGQGRFPIEQGLIILGMVSQKEDLGQLNLGEKNLLLLQIRESNFGQSMLCFTRCPQCTQALEFVLDTQTLINSQLQTIKPSAAYTIILHNQEATVRLPNSNDLIVCLQHNNRAQVRQRLLQRCLLSENDIENTQWSDELWNQLAECMRNFDPLSETLFNHNCPDCSHQWQSLFHIDDFLWQEIAAYAQRLLTETAQLAAAFSWSEESIMAMSFKKRQFYLEKINI